MKSLWTLMVFMLYCVASGYTQESEGKKKFGARESGLRIGYTVGQYTFRQAAADIYFYRLNHTLISNIDPQNRQIVSVEKDFKPVQTFRGIHLGGEMNEENYQLEFYFTTRKATSTSTYSCLNALSNAIEIENEKVRLRYNSITFAAGYPFKRLPIALGVNMDIGVLRAQHKYESLGNKWRNWFSTEKIFGGGQVPKTQVATYGLYLNLYLGKIMFKVNQNFTLLDGGLNSQSKKYTNLPNSTKVFPMANTSITASFKF